jgi:hypothetical protein
MVPLPRSALWGLAQHSHPVLEADLLDQRLVENAFPLRADQDLPRGPVPTGILAPSKSDPWPARSPSSTT